MMKKPIPSHVDFLVAGSGFAGTILAMGLKRAGFEVGIVEKKQHPRFAVGESSTPIADMILRHLAERLDLPFLKNMSRYGEWQRTMPGVICGLKRGFSYYGHRKGELFRAGRDHSRELLVAASSNDDRSDTHWLRSDVDHFLVKEACKLDIFYLDQTEIISVERDRAKEKWHLGMIRGKKNLQLGCTWLIDATGSPEFSGRFLGTSSSSGSFETDSGAIYSHFERSGCWMNELQRQKAYTGDYPFSPDHSALHHLIHEGWVWMLRFNNGLLSAGMVFDHAVYPAAHEIPAGEQWKMLLESYPSLNAVFKNAVPAPGPGGFHRTRRLQRKLNRMCGEGWTALPHTAGFIDPLHSTGIAFALCGVEKLLTIFTEDTKNEEIINGLEKFQIQTSRELSFIDLLVSSCYKSRWNFSLHTAAVMLYFAASITYEQERLAGHIPDTFLCAGEDRLFEMVRRVHDAIAKCDATATAEEVRLLIHDIRKEIAPYNRAGLLHPGAGNMYHHTAVEI